MWNVVIDKVRHEQQVFSSAASIERLDAHNIHARDVEFIVVVFMRRDMENWSKRNIREGS
jgi:hypothetical protein